MSAVKAFEAIWPEVESRLKRAGVDVEPIRDRVESIATSYVDLSLRSLAGEDVEKQLAIVEASQANLESATSMLVVSTVRDSVRAALVGAIRGVFSLLGSPA